MLHRVKFHLWEFAMSIMIALRDFADGFRRGLGLYFTERNEHLERAVALRFWPKSRG